MGHPEWITDERFQDWQHRQLNKEDLYKCIESYTVNYDKYELTKTLGAAGIPVSWNLPNVLLSAAISLSP